MKKTQDEGLFKAEAKIQQEIVMYYRNTYCLKHHEPRCMILSIPNEGRGAASMQLLATGLYPGAADLMVIHQGKPMQWAEPDIFFVECKADGGVQSDKQKTFQEHCEAMGIGYFIVRSLEDFKAVINNL